MAGMMSAYLLAEVGANVAVLDDGPVGGGMTARSTAHITHALDDRYSFIASVHGREGARQAAASHTAAIAEIERVALNSGFECGFSRLDGYLFAPPETSLRELESEFQALRSAGLTQVQMVPRIPGIRFDSGPALRFPGQGQFHPVQFLNALAVALVRQGGQIFCGNRVTTVRGGSEATVRTSNGCNVRAKSVVVTTNVPMNDRVIIHNKQAPYTTYVIGLCLPEGAMEPMLLWDLGQTEHDARQRVGPAPYHYVRLAKVEDQQVLLVGGEDHKTAQAEDALQRFGRLEAWARKHFPQAGGRNYAWSGQVMEPVDAMAYIGHNPTDEANVYVATGDSGNGITHGAVAGMLIRDLILGRENPWAALYDPRRKKFSPSVLADYAKESLNVAAQFRDYVTSGDVTSTDQIPSGEGAILRDGFHKLAVYRDPEGHLHEFSAVCPHLRCMVRWDPVEKTWDCPCHGSRFSCLGEVINGPATSNLEMVHAMEQRS